MIHDARRAAEEVARLSYGRLVAFLAARGWGLTAAEDALGEAFAAALEHWPSRGIPPKPEAWLLVTARNYLRDEARRTRVRESAAVELTNCFPEAEMTHFPDERLKLLFICAHPAIDRAMRTPLMLQIVLGLDAASIGSAFLVAPSTMGQRLVRAKNKIFAAKLRFEVPESSELPGRLAEVLEAIYAAYGTAWEGDSRWRELTGEAIALSRMMTELLPDEAEGWGLLSLLLYCESRRGARRNGAGAFVPLLEQDVRLWDTEMVKEAERALQRASSFRRGLGSFQLEAAIQSAHASRAWTGHTPWEAIALLYEGLAQLSPTAAVRAGQAAAVGEAFGPDRGLSLLDRMASDERYQPYWACRAHLLGKAGRMEEARAAYAMAAGLTTDEAVRNYLLRMGIGPNRSD